MKTSVLRKRARKKKKKEKLITIGNNVKRNSRECVREKIQ
jgi:hypothetical protein